MRQSGHSALLSSSLVGTLRHRWWKLCLQRKCTVGRSRVAPHAEQRVALNVCGLEPRAASSADFLSVSARYAWDLVAIYGYLPPFAIDRVGQIPFDHAHGCDAVHAESLDDLQRRH